MSRWKAGVLLISMLLGCAGWMMLQEGEKHPVYHSGFSPGDMSFLMEEGDRDERNKRWYDELAKYETPHKRLTDGGRGLMFFSAGMAFGVYFLMIARKGFFSKQTRLAIYWLFLWGAIAPFDIYYFRLCFERLDYPIWADSMAIPYAGSVLAAFVGFFITHPILRRLLKNRVLSSRVILSIPQRGERIRSCLVGCWILLLLHQGIGAALGGMMGSAFSCIAAIPVLLLVMAARKQMAGGVEELPTVGEASGCGGEGREKL